MDRNIQAVFVMVIINTVLAFFLASQPIGASSPFKGLFTRISDTYKAVFEANQSAQSEVVFGEEGHRDIARTSAVTGNLHPRGHPAYLSLGCYKSTFFTWICCKAHFLPKF